MFQRILIISFLSLFYFFVKNSLVQDEKKFYYIYQKNNKIYTQEQFDSITNAYPFDSGNLVVKMKTTNKGEFVDVEFDIISFQSIETVKKKWLNKKIPNFLLKNLRGVKYSNNNIQGKITIINFWSVTCIPCIDEIEDLNKLVQTYSSKEILFLAPAPESSRQILNVLLNRDFKYIVLPKAKSLFFELGLPGYPYHFVVDKEGFIRYIQTGTTDPKTRQKIAKTGLKNAIEQVLKK